MDRPAPPGAAPPTPPAEGVRLSGDQTLEIMIRLAAAEAAAAARQRVNVAIGLLATGLTIFGAVIVALLNDRIEELAGPIVEEEIGDQLATASLLPLLVSEALSFDDVYNAEKADRLLVAAAELAPQVLVLEGLQRELALRRIEDLVDAFAGAGDHYRVEALYAAFGAPLLEFDGIRFTMALVLARIAVIEGTVPPRIRPLAAAVGAHPNDPAGATMEAVRTMTLIFDLADAAWEEDGLRQAVLRERERYDGFPWFLYDEFDTIAKMTAPDAREPRKDAHRRATLLSEIVAPLIPQD